MQKAFKYLFATFLILASLIQAQYSYASFSDMFNTSLNETAKETGHADMESKVGKTFPEMAAKFINTALSILGNVFLVLVIYAGFIWFNAKGNDSEVKKAQQILRNAIIGLFLVLAAYAITRFVSGAINAKVAG